MKKLYHTIAWRWNCAQAQRFLHDPVRWLKHTNRAHLHRIQMQNEPREGLAGGQSRST